ncbi:class I SAM-dependent methyltransferase [Methanosarcina sp. UBA5]|uniref:class I SAM-dependent methyltransferase n=1 Tax=Methanosarcina sp. UBA5 TaxID=1915593 RepID=UPI0025D75A18|nr:methyltransferase domain-containing protein [Methanosarcina sp. UBA5]
MSSSEIQIKEMVAHKWDLASETFDTHAGHGIQSQKERDAWKRAFRDVFPEKGLKILDVGCGTGELSLLFAEIGHEVAGIDISRQMLKVAKVKAEACGADITFREGDAENPPFDTSSFDIVFSRHLLWTLPNPKVAVENWNRVLRKNGKVVIIDGVWDKGTLEFRVRRNAGALLTLLLERKDPRKGHSDYSNELKARLPHSGGAPLEKVKEYLSNSGFENIQVFDLKEVRAAQKEKMPLGERIVRSSQYYLICGRK